ncbi:YDG domain-containing protein [Raphanus sativus]|uniref:YDG domain-containing protein At5g47150-like n=1 Tax=Raphanus sativus TaxID=3726 RepID=A0A9W3C3A0_RAPSA|nr:YDG domain-containing protein At5g47150-like [Raphanus sativus]KAJ4888593.1 YDG domain-containing protein [Raphanus sativus]
MDASRKRSIVYAVRDYPLGCGTHSQSSIKIPRTTDHPDSRPYRNSDRHDHVLVAPLKPKETNCLKQEDPARFNISVRHDCDVAAAAPKRERTCLKQEPAFRNSLHDRGFADPKLRGKQEAAFRSSDQHVLAAAPKLKGACFKQEAEIRSSDQQHDLTPREQVLEVLRHFKDVFKQLDRDKQARRLGGDLFDATARIDIRALDVLEKMGKLVNTEKRIGLVPGINVGDEFQYKTELRLVGLHFKTMCGIDYMSIGDVKLATSIVASEGYGYSDKFGAGVVVYTGEGGNVVSKEKKTEDQRLVKGNLALANSMRKRSLVRVIRGEERLDKKGKRYVYDGLYLVDKYWLEKEVRGTSVYKFKLCRVSGQTSLLT